jgi:biofilm PGA synthesis N-glycosyltransferase PgaC
MGTLGTATLAVALLALLHLRLAIDTGELDVARFRRRLTGGEPNDWQGRVAILIATRNGENTIEATIASAIRQADVYVVSDGSTDDTAEVARICGAHVLELAENVGKPAALYWANYTFLLSKRYEAIAILDDDTVVAPDFIDKAINAMRPGVAIVVGRTITLWDRSKRWNVWVGSRAYAYWRYQTGLRRGQSALNAMNCISGSNSVYRSSVIDAVIVEKTPYAVDDTWWTLETIRRGLGRIVYAHQARAWICDPVSMRDWYRQNVRWNWGMFQGIWGHHVGRRRTRFDFLYGLVILDWVAYVTAAPGALVLMWWFDVLDPVRFFGAYLAAVLVWVTLAAAATGKWRMIPMAPAFVVIDWIYRATFVHAFIKTVRQPKIEVCRWESPARYS